MINNKFTFLFGFLICVCESTLGSPYTSAFKNVSCTDVTLNNDNNVASHDSFSECLSFAGTKLKIDKNSNYNVSVNKSPETNKLYSRYQNTGYCKTAADTVKITDNMVFDVVDQMPTYIGGIETLFKYLSENINYPDSAEAQGIEGKVILKFCVEKDGSIGEVMVLKSLCPECDAEAVRVVKSMPKWIPGKQNGENVRVWYTLPVLYKLSADETNVSFDDVEEFALLIKKQLPIEVPNSGISINNVEIIDHDLVYVIETESIENTDSLLSEIENNEKLIYSLCGMYEGMDLLCRSDYGLGILVVNKRTFKNSYVTIPSERLTDIYNGILKDSLQNFSFMELLNNQIKLLSLPQKLSDVFTITEACIKDNEVCYVFKINSEDNNVDESLLRSEKKALIDDIRNLLNMNEKWKNEI